MSDAGAVGRGGSFGVEVGRTVTTETDWSAVCRSASAAGAASEEVSHGF